MWLCTVALITCAVSLCICVQCDYAGSGDFHSCRACFRLYLAAHACSSCCGARPRDKCSDSCSGGTGRCPCGRCTVWEGNGGCYAGCKRCLTMPADLDLDIVAGLVIFDSDSSSTTE